MLPQEACSATASNLSESILCSVYSSEELDVQRELRWMFSIIHPLHCPTYKSMSLYSFKISTLRCGGNGGTCIRLA
jgi:hypothetical protein